jgi:hypothetical protein
MHGVTWCKYFEGPRNNSHRKLSEERKQVGVGRLVDRFARLLSPQRGERSYWEVYVPTKGQPTTWVMRVAEKG